MRRFGRIGAVSLTVAALTMLVLPHAGAEKVLNPGPFTLEPAGQSFVKIRNLIFDLTPRFAPQCSDGIDNDNDFRVDAAADNGCFAPPGGVAGQDDSELAAGYQPKENVSIAGTVDAQGMLVAPASSVTFPPAYIPIVHPFDGSVTIVKATVVPTHPVQGTVDPLSGKADIRVRFKVRLEGNVFGLGLGLTCTIGNDVDPIDLNTLSTTGGVAYNPRTGAATLKNETFRVPPASGCPIGLFNVNELINGQIGIPSPSGANAAEFTGLIKPVLTRAIESKITTSPTPVKGDAPLTVQFDGGSSVVKKLPASYLWTFPGGETASGQMVSRTFSTAGRGVVYAQGHRCRRRLAHLTGERGRDAADRHDHDDDCGSDDVDDDDHDDDCGSDDDDDDCDARRPRLTTDDSTTTTTTAAADHDDDCGHDDDDCGCRPRRRLRLRRPRRLRRDQTTTAARRRRRLRLPTTTTTTTAPSAKDTATITVSGAVKYQNSAPGTSGNMVVHFDDNGVQSAGGQLMLPGTKGGTARMTVWAQRLWMFNLWTGNVDLYDPMAGVSVGAPVFGTVSKGSDGKTVSGVSTWFRFGQFPDLIQTYNIAWSITDNS